MARRLDVELTSTLADGNYTWRAAGAKKPKGELDATLVPAGVGVGDVVRIEAIADLEGLTVTTVFAPKEKRREPERIELLGRVRSEPPVTAVISSRRPLDVDREDRGRRRGKAGRSTDPKQRSRRRSGKTRDNTDGKSKQVSRRRSRDTRDNTDTEASAPTNRQRSQDADNKARSQRSRRRSESKEQVRREQPRAPRLRPGRVHRAAALDALPEMQRELAEEVLRGGVPGVRDTIDRMNDKAIAEGIPKIKKQPLVILAEQMAPVLKAAEWRDRADAALAALDKVDLRDIRSVVSSAEAGARGEEAIALADQLKNALAARVDREHRNWLNELSVTITEGRTIRALRLSSHPPKAGAPLPVDLATRLSQLASAGLTADTGSTRWSTIIEAVAYSPVRNQVVPEGAPSKPSPELLAMVDRLAPRIAALAKTFDIESPPEVATRPRRDFSPRSRQATGSGQTTAKKPKSSTATPAGKP